MKGNNNPEKYVDGSITQLRKGFLSYCVMRICSQTPRYTSDIIQALHQVDMVVVEGTIYPLMSRLQKDGILTYEWRESEQGPPRKYFVLSDFGQEVRTAMEKKINELQDAMERL